MIGNEPQILPLIAASGVEIFVILLLMAISSLVNWIQKRKQGGQDEWAEMEQPKRSPGAPPRQASDWEEELRRILKSEPPPAPPAPPVIQDYQPVPPPVPSSKPATPPPPPPVVPSPLKVKTCLAHCEQCDGHIEFPPEMMGDDIRCPHCYQQTRLYPFSPTTVERRAHQPETTPVLPHLPAPVPTPEQQQLAARLAQAGPRSASWAKTSKKRTPGNLQDVVALFRNPQTARQAVIASVILNPPKALEP